MSARDDQIVREAVEESKSHGGRQLIAALGAIAIGLLILAGVMFYNGYANTRDQAEAGTDLAEQVKLACDSGNPPSDLSGLCDRANEVVESAPPVVKGDKGDPGIPGIPGPPPSDAQVANAVALYCSGGRCDGEPGSDGRSVTTADVRNAVAAYCNNRGQCRGPKGGPGAEGQEGPEGPPGEPGQDAPPPTQEQIDAAVANYCSTRNECRGPQGERGPAGSEGRGITRIECEGPPTQVFIIYYSDGTSDRVECSPSI